MFDRLEKLELRQPGPRARAIIEAHGSVRGMTKEKLQPVDGLCCWCEERPIKRKRGKYCSPDCNESALFNCYPQTPSAKAFILVQLQACACARCGQSYEDEIKARIAKWVKLNEQWFKKPDRAVTYWQIGNNTGDIWHVDHIHPIHKGGAGAGLANIQVLCVPCHKAKTRDDING